MNRSFSSLPAAAAALLIFGIDTAQAQPSLSIETGVQLNWLTSTGNIYQPQWSPSSSTAWSALGAPVSGTGMTNSLYDPAPMGARQYQVLEMVPGSAPTIFLPTNGGFEFAGNWAVTTAAAGPVYGVRTNTDPRSGSFHFEAHVASTGGGPVLEFSQSSVPVTGGTVYPFAFFAKASTGSAGYSARWRILWNAGGDTGYRTFTPGNNTYAWISNSVTAPASATSASIIFRLEGAASPSQSATVQFDDVVLGSGGSGPGNPGATNIVAVFQLPVAKISWLSAAGIEYQPASTANSAAGPWTNLSPVILGDGGVKTILLPLARNAEFVRLQIPSAAVQPPANLHTIASGSTNAIGLAWAPSPTFGVTGYRVLFGVSSNDLTNSTDVGNVTSTIISGLTPGQTYYLAVITLAPSGESLAADATITAQTDSESGIVPLFDAGTILEPPTTIDTPESLITRVADRARDRHAREADFHIYDHYLSWYWEQRVATIEIIDRVGKAGPQTVTFNYTTQDQLNPAEFRAFFRGLGTVAEYHFNAQAALISTNASGLPGETDYNYSVTVTSKLPENRTLQVGDRMEIEISQFLLAPRHGRNNYYGTAILYIVGQGIVPWEAVGPLLDSFPLTNTAWLGGQTTLPYQYSNEPEHRFKQMAGNISPTNGHPFMLGRRLHHTDFGDGRHSEPDNPIFTDHAGKLGPKFIARSCVECHVNNGRALPPAIGAPMLQSVVKVGSNASGLAHPSLGSVLQPQVSSGTAEAAVALASYTETAGQYGDGTPYSLRKPNYAFQGVTPEYFSVRLAPQLVGIGLLEAVSESTITALADPDDANADGISGRLQIVTDPETGHRRLGRFNYKGGKSRLSHQIAGALNSDLGVTTAIFPMLDGETTSSAPEISNIELDQMTRYVALLGVGARRDMTSVQALQGEELFTSANCVKCHTPTLTTSAFHPMTELRSQTIRPYTDLLLHDMGAGLADNMGEAGAAGSEWRTSPLWNIGLTAGVSGGEAYLHDGRARSLEEAILWHGGEAEAAKQSFRAMSATERAALIKFLKSL